MRRLSREQWVGSGTFALFLALTGLNGGDQQPSVAHAALNMLNNRPSEHVLMQTVPPLPTETPTPESTTAPTAEFTLTPTRTPFPTSTETPTPEPSATPTTEFTSTPTSEFTPTATRTPLPTSTETPTPELTPGSTPDTRPPCVADILGFDEEGNFGTVPLQLNEPDGHVLQVGGVQSYGLESGSTSYEIGAQLPFTFTGQLESVGGYSVVVFDNTAECQIESVEIAGNNPIGGYGEISVDEAIPQTARSSQDSTRLVSDVKSNQDGSVNIQVADTAAGVTINTQIESGVMGYSPSTPDSFKIQGEATAAIAHFSGPNQDGDVITATLDLGAITPNEKRDIVINENDQGQTEVVISTDTNNDGIPESEKVIVDENGDGILTPEEEVPQTVKYEIYLPLIDR